MILCAFKMFLIKLTCNQPKLVRDDQGIQDRTQVILDQLVMMKLLVG